jgi:hypothetical protein
MKYVVYRHSHRASYSFAMSVRPSDGTEQLGYDRTDCHYGIYVCIFQKTVQKIQVSIKSDQNSRYFT